MDNTIMHDTPTPPRPRRAGLKHPGVMIWLMLALAGLTARPAGGAERGTAAEDRQTSGARQAYVQAKKEANLQFLARARDTLTRALATDPDDWRLNRLLIEVHANMNQTHLLIPYYTNRIAREPKNAVGYAGAALVNFNNREAGLGVDFLKRASQLSSTCLAVLDVQACHPEGNTRLKPRQIEEGYERLITRYPDFSEGYLAYLAWLWNQGSPGRVKRLLARAKARGGLDPAILIYEIRLRQEDVWYDTQNAIAVYERILALDPTKISIKLRLAAVCGERGNAARQERLLWEITEQAPESTSVWGALARFEADHQRYDLAGQALLRARETPYENVLKSRLDLERADYLVQAGEFDAAIGLLKEIMEKQKGSMPAMTAATRLTTLLSRKPEDRIYRLRDVPYLVQRGAYCGPASLAMALGYWGEKKSQDEIAAVIYTGIAGTAPQTIQEYCAARGYDSRAFRGDVKTWKRLLDQGIPILWLKYTGLSGHYVVVVGYDDLTKRFLLHNPWQAEETGVGYEDLGDEWPLPELRLSLAIYPRARAAGLQLGALAAPLTFRAINTVTYLTTGSNLFQGFLPPILLNLAFMAIFILLDAALLAWTCHPCPRGFLKRMVALHVAVIVLLGFMIHEYRFTQGVSLFMAHQASLIALGPLLALNGALTWLFRKTLTATQAARLNGALLLAFATIGWVNWRGGENLAIPEWVLALGVALSVYELWIIMAAGRLKTRMNYDRTLARLRKYGSAHPRRRGMLEAWLREAALEMRRRNFNRALDVIGGLQDEGRVGKYFTARLQRMRAACLILRAQQEQEPERAGLLDALRVMAELKEKKAGRLETDYLDILHARALLLRGDLEQADALCRGVQGRRAARDWWRLLQQGLQWLRGQGEEHGFYCMLHALNRLELARAAGDRVEAARLDNEYRDFRDLRFSLQLRFQAEQAEAHDKLQMNYEK